MKKLAKLFILFLILLTPVIVSGDSVAPPFSYSVESSNGKYVFVMIAPISVERDGLFMRDEDKKAAQRIRAKYQVSGLYLNDNSTTPLWTVDWYAYSALVASDGIHLVREGPWAQNSSTEAFTFFANGKPVRSWKVGELVDTAMLPHSVSHFMWEESMQLDDRNQTLTVVTMSKDRYLFDFTTGERLSSRRPMRGIAVLVLAVIGFVATMLIKRRIVRSKVAV